MYSGFPSYYTCACIWDGSIACIASVALANKTSRCILANTIANILVRVFALVDICSKTRIPYLLGAPNYMSADSVDSRLSNIIKNI